MRYIPASAPYPALSPAPVKFPVPAPSPFWPQVSETENIRKNLAIERMIVEGCDILLDVNQVFVRQGTLIQVRGEHTHQTGPLAHTGDTLNIRVTGPQGNSHTDFSNQLFMSDKFHKKILDSEA